MWMGRLFSFGIDDVDSFEFAHQYTRIAYLTTAFGVERRLVQYHLVECLVFLLHLTVAQDAGFIFCIVVTYKFSGTFLQRNPVAGFYGGGVAGTLLLLLHLGVELLRVGRHAVLAQDEFGQVEREAEGVIQRKGVLTADFLLAGSFGLGHGLVEQADTRLQRTQEGFFFFLDDLGDQLALGVQFGVGTAHILNQHRQELVHEGLFLAQESVAVTYGTAQDAADDVARLGVAGQLAVGDGEGDGTNVVSDDTHGDIRLLVVSVLLAA